MTTASTIILVIIALVVGAVIAWLLLGVRRSKHLRQQFGPEYRHTVKELGSRKRAESELTAREERVHALALRSLSKEERDRFLAEWRSIQEAFVDAPGPVIDRADRLIGEVMQARGYPMSDFEQRAADVSVDHPHVVSTYRRAHELAVSNARGTADTEDLRKAMIYFRDLFEDLLEMPGSRTEVPR